MIINKECIYKSHYSQINMNNILIINILIVDQPFTITNNTRKIQLDLAFGTII